MAPLKSLEDSNLVVNISSDEEGVVTALNDETYDPDIVIVPLVRKKTLLTRVKIDLLNGEVMEGEAVVDTGSVLSFISQEAVEKCAPELLQKVEPSAIMITGISGERVKSSGYIHLPCRIAGRVVSHRFVVAGIVEPVLIGVDFLKCHQATWDWTTGDLVYQDTNHVSTKHSCCLLTAQEIPAESVACLRVSLSEGCLTSRRLLVEGLSGIRSGLVVADSLNEITDDSVAVLVENRSGHSQWLPEGSILGHWTPIEDEDQVITVSECEVVEEQSVPKNCSPDCDFLAEMETVIPSVVKDELSSENVNASMKLFKDFRHIFALKSAELGRTDWVVHQIDVGESNPIKLPPRRIPLHKVDAVEKAIMEMESTDDSVPPILHGRHLLSSSRRKTALPDSVLTTGP